MQRGTLHRPQSSRAWARPVPSPGAVCVSAPDPCDSFAYRAAPRSPSCGTPGPSGREFRAQIMNHKRNSILQFSGTPATGFLGRLGGQASSPISYCCNDMLSLDCRLEGVPSVPKSCRKWRFSSEIRASVHSSDLAVLGLAWSSRVIVCCEPSAFPSSLILPPSSFIQAREPAVCGMFRDPDPSRSGGRGSPGPSPR
jgi:hypothetical protein